MEMVPSSEARTFINSAKAAVRIQDHYVYIYNLFGEQNGNKAYARSGALMPSRASILITSVKLIIAGKAAAQNGAQPSP